MKSGTLLLVGLGVAALVLFGDKIKAALAGGGPAPSGGFVVNEAPAPSTGKWDVLNNLVNQGGAAALAGIAAYDAGKEDPKQTTEERAQAATDDF